MNSLNFKQEYAWALIGVLACTILAAFVSLQVGVFVLFFLILGWWSWQNPTESFLFLIVLAPLLPMFKVTQTLDTITLAKDIITGILLLRVVIVPLVKKQLPYRRNILWLPMVFLTVWIGFNMLRANSHALGILRARDLLSYMLLFFVALYMPRTKEFYRRVLTWFLASAAIVSLLGIYQWFFVVDSSVLRFDPTRKIWIPRISSTLGHPSIFGQYLILLAAVLASLTATVKKNSTRYMWATLMLITAPFVYLTYSRAVWVGYFLTLAAIVIVNFGRGFVANHKIKVLWRPVAASSVFSIILLFLVLRFTSASVFFRSAFDPTYASNQDRIEFLVRLVAPISNTQAIIGSGLGNVTAQNFITTNVSSVDIATGEARNVQVAKNATLVDNQYLKTFVELGFIGLVLYAWLFWRLIKATLFVSIRGNTIEGRIIGLCVAGFVVAFLVQALFIDIWDIFPTNAAFWILAAFVSREACLTNKTNA